MLRRPTLRSASNTTARLPTAPSRLCRAVGRFDSVLVSVCIPTYNYARFIGRAIESVLDQSHRDLELIVIDDASTDGTPEVVEPYLSDARVSFRLNERNVGLFANFNRCFELARGDYVKVLCADDWLHPLCIEDALAAFAASPDIGMVTSAGYLVDVSGVVTGVLRAPFGHDCLVPGRRAIAAHADWGNAAGMPSHVLLRRSVIDEVGGFEPALAPASDMHLWLKVLVRYDLGWIERPRCYLRIHSTRTHDYGADPTEASFLLWEDMARRKPDLVDDRLLRRALYREARHCLLYVVAHAVRLRLRRAARILRFASRHVRWRSVVPRFALDLPEIAFGQAARVYALSTGRLVIYDPRPRAGPRLDHVGGVPDS